MTDWRNDTEKGSKIFVETFKRFSVRKIGRAVILKNKTLEFLMCLLSLDIPSSFNWLSIIYHKKAKCLRANKRLVRKPASS